MGKRYSKEVREEVIGKVRSGQKVADVGQAYVRYQGDDDSGLAGEGYWFLGS